MRCRICRNYLRITPSAMLKTVSDALEESKKTIILPLLLVRQTKKGC